MDGSHSGQSPVLVGSHSGQSPVLAGSDTVYIHVIAWFAPAVNQVCSWL